MGQQQMPLSIVIMSAKNEIFLTVNEIIQKYRLPASLADGIISSLLSQIRELENAEILRAATESKRETTESKGEEK